MGSSFSIQTLADAVDQWCSRHGVLPANGQAAQQVNVRNIRYYRTLGLLDAPEAGGFGEKHRLQLVAIRLLQAKGLPLRRIRELLYGRSLAELEEIERRGLEELFALPLPTADELWRMIPLDDDFLLFSRRGTQLTAAQRQAILQALNTPTHEKTPALKRTSRARRMA